MMVFTGIPKSTRVILPPCADLKHMGFTLETYEHLKQYGKLMPSKWGSLTGRQTFQERIEDEAHRRDYERRHSDGDYTAQRYTQYRDAHLSMAAWVASAGKPIALKATLTIDGEGFATLVKSIKKVVPTQKRQKELDYTKLGIFGIVMLETSPTSEALHMTTPIINKENKIGAERAFILSSDIPTGAFNVFIKLDTLTAIAPTLIGYTLVLEAWQGYSQFLTIKAYTAGKCINTLRVKLEL